MSMTSAYSREQLRQAYSDAWRKRIANVPLSPLEATIADVIAWHPQYQALVADPAGALAYESSAALAEENPFLHMGLHLAVRDQLAVDRPPGIRELHCLLQSRRADPHAAEHDLMQALAEVLWQAQRDGRSPDEQHYLALARRRAPPPG
jgi:hypothetical protein